MTRRLFSCCASFERLLCAVIGLLCFAGAGAPAWAQFETRATTPFPQGSFSIATGDFNNDGKLDVVMITDAGFSVALGNGDGTFQTPVTYTTQLSYSLAVADFNNDGNLDIVVANENLDPSTVSVYLGNGDGTFRSPIDSNTTSYNEFVAVGDFNGDGKMDIVVIENPYISVLLGNGDGTFQPPSDNDSFVGAHWLALADFNNDHKLDVLVTGYFGGSYDIGVLLGNGDGTLQNSLTYPVEYVPATVAAGDLNGDGKMDAILGYDLAGIAVFLGNGDGSFQPALNYNTTGIGNGEVVVSDMNLDGRLDVAVPSALGLSATTGVDVLWGNGDGTLEAAQFFATGPDTGSPALGDLNGDHLPDLVFGNGLAGVISMLNTGVASFSPSAPMAFPVQLVNTISARQKVTLTNNGTTTLTIRSMRVSGQFKISSTCGNSVAAGASCAISAEFKPTSAGTQTGSITLIDSASSKPQFIELLGTATAVKVSPGYLKFASQSVGTKSAPQTLTVTNEGTASIKFNSVAIGGKDSKDFTENNTCVGPTIEPGASCQVKVTFTPTETGALGATLDLNVEAGTSPSPVALLGTGS